MAGKESNDGSNIGFFAVGLALRIALRCLMLGVFRSTVSEILTVEKLRMESLRLA